MLRLAIKNSSSAAKQASFGSLAQHRTLFSSRVWLSEKNAISSVKEGTPLNINIKKGGQPLVALKDEEYPEWLWELLDDAKQKQQLLEKDPVKYQKKHMRSKNVAKIKHNNFLAQM